uniref:Zinc finger protein ZF(C2H2)-80 n=1 Tax=Phallusia mammillata TaxID=59560 RepID=A0A6F9DX08_9ASCI|nr:zinc finger protein ZF(C2H2)-80 [Phallusia mammillata]
MTSVTRFKLAIGKMDDMYSHDGKYTASHGAESPTIDNIDSQSGRQDDVQTIQGLRSDCRGYSPRCENTLSKGSLSGSESPNVLQCTSTEQLQRQNAKLTDLVNEIAEKRRQSLTDLQLQQEATDHGQSNTGVGFNAVALSETPAIFRRLSVEQKAPKWNRRKQKPHKNLQHPVETNEAHENEGDFITCGRCSKIFPLSAFVQFIQHKQHSCKPEVTSDDHVISPDVSNDAKRRSCVETSDVSVQVSIGAPSNGPGGRSVESAPTLAMPIVDLTNPLIISTDGLSKTFLTSPVKTEVA